MTGDQTPRYSIIFDGELVEGVSRKAALVKLSHLTNLSEVELLDCLFSVRPVIAAQADNYQLADQFREQFRQAGLEVSTQAYAPCHDDIINAELSFGHYAPLETQYSEANFVVDTPVSASLQKSDIHQQDGKYLVTFNGSLLSGFERKQVMANLCSLTNSSELGVLENIFSAIPVIICQTDDRELTQAYQQAFEQTGLEVKVLSNERLSTPEIAARSYLLIRDDKPSSLPEKKVQCFTYTLYGLAVLACLGWVLIYMVIDSYLKNDVEQSIQVQLVQYKAVEKIAKPSPPPIKKNKTAKKPQPTKKKAPEPVKEQKKEVKPSIPPEEKTVPVKEQKKVVEKKEDKKLQKLKGEYNLQLLNWFARFQQLNQLESKYAEGEITLRLTIARNGEIKKIEVLKSTSEELQRIVVMQLRKAKTVPGIPIKITGSEYSFELPLRYRFN
jgi:hypothetical protein